jgi:hypothetical protein
MKRTFTAQEKEFIFDTWKMGIGIKEHPYRDSG